MTGLSAWLDHNAPPREVRAWSRAQRRRARHHHPRRADRAPAAGTGAGRGHLGVRDRRDRDARVPESGAGVRFHPRCRSVRSARIVVKVSA